jgi:DNA polymerase-3 subunit delta
LKFFDLKKSINGGEVSPIYYFYGDDRFLLQRGIEMLKERFLQEPDFNYNIFDGSKMTGDSFLNLLSALKSFPLLSEKRIVLAEGLNITDKDYKNYLESYFIEPLESTIFIITESENQTKKFDFKKLRSVNSVNCNRGDSTTISKWIYSEFKKAGLQADSDAIELMCDYTLCSMTRLSTETAKLIDYAKGSKIDIELVKKLVAKESEYQLYEMTNEIAKGNYNSAFVILNDLKNKGVNNQLLLIKIFSYFRNLFHIAISSKTNKELSEILKVKEYAIKMMKIQASAFSSKNLRIIVSEFAKLDSMSKSGGIDSDDALQLGVFNILMKNNA